MSMSPIAQPAVRATAATMLTVEIAIHAALAPAHLAEVPYIGASFVIASGLLAVALIAITVSPSNRMGWRLGAVLCAGMAVTFVISRLIGLPGYHEDWSSDGGLGLVSLPPEAVFLFCALRTRTRWPLSLRERADGW